MRDKLILPNILSKSICKHSLAIDHGDNGSTHQLHFSLSHFLSLILDVTGKRIHVSLHVYLMCALVFIASRLHSDKRWVIGSMQMDEEVKCHWECNYSLLGVNSRLSSERLRETRAVWGTKLAVIWYADSLQVRSFEFLQIKWREWKVWWVRSRNNQRKGCWR